PGTASNHDPLLRRRYGHDYLSLLDWIILRYWQRLSRSDAIPEAQADQFAACFKTKEFRVHLPAMTKHQSPQHFNLLRFAGSITFKGNMLSQLLNRLPVIPLFLCFCHVSRHSLGNYTFISIWPKTMVARLHGRIQARSNSGL